jgi:hypothetical protein
MLVVWTPKGRADPLGQLVSAEQPIAFYHFALAVRIHLGSMALSQGLLVGK